MTRETAKKLLPLIQAFAEDVADGDCATATEWLSKHALDT